MSRVVPSTGSSPHRQLHGRRALVTGGSLGIGQSIVRLLALHGASVAIQHAGSVDAAIGHGGAASELAEFVRREGGLSCEIDSDFNQPGAARDSVMQAERQIGPLDTVFVCASVQTREPFVSIQLETALRQFHVNYWATIELLQQVIPGMQTRRYGRVVSIGSINQDRPSPDLAVYASLKAAQHNLIVNLAKAYVTDGITFNTVSPGLVHTPRSDWRRKASMAQWEKFQASSNPMGRAGRPEEVAQVAVNLVLENTGFMTGVNIGIDGGGNL